MKVLNLYAGIGGNRKLWKDVEVTAVEMDPKIARIYKDHFPGDTLVIGDAHQYLLDHFMEFDFIWASPPCPTHSRIRKQTLVPRGWVDPIYPNMMLYEEILFLQGYFDGKYCVENVISWYDPLIKPQVLGRHYFWANFIIRDKDIEPSLIAAGTIEELQDRKGFDLSNYNHINKKTILRNCTEPELGALILDCARGNTQQTLVASINSKSKRTSIDTKQLRIKTGR